MDDCASYDGWQTSSHGTLAEFDALYQDFAPAAPAVGMHQDFAALATATGLMPANADNLHIGTYMQRRYLGMLLYPVAVCHLHTFFEDIETWFKVVARTENDPGMKPLETLESDVKSRLNALPYNFPQGYGGGWASIVYYIIGCLVSAITYLHNQKLRNKDLKPSNILLSPGRLRLSDFGSATDFTQLSQSATNNECATLPYFASE